MNKLTEVANPLGRGLYALVDTAALGDRNPVDFARRVLRSGAVCALQLRVKGHGAREFLRLARAIAPLCERVRVPFFVNDRPDIAALANARGVHVGMEDLSVEDARGVARGCLVGASSHNDDEVAAVLATDADYLAFGPVFGTRSKSDPAPTVGIEALSRITARVARPVVAIGGITPANAHEVRLAGAHAGAVISALMVHDDNVTAQARELHRLLGGE